MLALLVAAPAAGQTPYGNAGYASYLLNEMVDVSRDFRDFSHSYYLADSLVAFDPATASGTIRWQQNRYITRFAFNNTLADLEPHGGNVFPRHEYEAHPVIPFALEFVSPRTVRLRVYTGPRVRRDEASLMLAGGRAPREAPWPYTRVDGGHRYTGPHGSVTVYERPWRVEFRDADGQLLTRTHHRADNAATYTPILPFSYVRRASDLARRVAAVFELSPGEKIFGGGESFTRLDKRGQRLVMWVDDPNGTQNEGMYKPIPFLLSSRGYGLFVHSTAPMTFDIGAYYSGVNSLMLGDDELDLFVFLGEPKEVLDAYTTLTGKAPVPPLWSFGLWMSRISYFSEAEVRDVAANLRRHRIPSDVIHLDTGWFETDWRTDYEFSPSRFDDPAGMIADLKKDGFRVSLWQLPYFVPKNRLFPEIVDKGLYVRDYHGGIPYDDVVLDFSNPEAVAWYRGQIAKLLELGVGAIKVDFGEAAPLNGVYASGRHGFFEHNLYPLRYNQVVADVTREMTGENIIWARSTWAGSQRYPVHWGGDNESTDQGMAATLRGGLSLGLSGFTFWSHDIGGFIQPTPEPLYRRWAPFGFLTSHTRSHGAPPKEPWLFSEAFLADYRRAAELKYRLMPYIYAQARHSAAKGLPMVRALFVEYPDDPGSWLVEDQYLFGADLLVAPLFEEANSRDVYLPPGSWIDYQTGQTFAGGWHHIEAGDIPVILLARDGAVIPHAALAQSTAAIDWDRLDLVVFAARADQATGRVALPTDEAWHEVTLARQSRDFGLVNDPLDGRVAWTIRMFSEEGR